MRVLTFLHSFEPGGVERVALRLVRRWRTLGVDAPLFIGRDEGALRGEVASDLAFDVPPQPRFGTHWWETSWMILKLPGHVSRTRPDVVFCAGSTYTVVALALKLALRSRCPPILAKISNDLGRDDLPRPARLAWSIWLRLQAKFIDRWVVMEDSILPDVDAHLGAVDRVVVPDPAIDGSQLPAPAGMSFGITGVIRHVAVGRLVHQKDHAVMLRAFAAGAGPNDTLAILGDGPLRSSLEQLAAALGIDHRVSFQGHCPNAAERLRQYDVMLLTSRYEGVPAVLIEALAAGVRIVATDCGPGVRALLDGDLGTLVPVGDMARIAAALRAEPARPHDRIAARERAARFTLEAAAGLYLAAMRGLIAHGRQRAPSARSALRVERAK